MQRVGNEMQIINQMAEEGKQDRNKADKARLGQARTSPSNCYPLYNCVK